MQPSKDNLEQYKRARKALIEEKARCVRDLEDLSNKISQLVQRLREIDQVLSEEGTGVSVEIRPRRGRPPGSGAGRGKGRNTLTLREAVRQVTWERPLSRREILEEVQKLGYRFSTRNPLNSLNQVIYNKNEFINLGGKFAPIGSPAAQQQDK